MSGAAAIDPSVGQAFLVAAAELGMCSAAWLFIRQVAEQGGDGLVAELRDVLGRDFPVLDAVAARWLEGHRAPRIELGGVLAACRGARRLLVVGLETSFLDALLPHLDIEQVGLLTHTELEPDWPRLLANYDGRLQACDLASFQRYAGARSVLLTFLYGAQAGTAHVNPAWLRVVSGDVRTQFRSLVGWEVLGGQMFVYPRWQAQTPVSDFSHVV